MDIMALDVLHFRETMHGRGINLSLDEVTSILRLADDMSDALGIAKEVGDGASLSSIYDKRLLSRVSTLEKQVRVLVKEDGCGESIIHCCECAECDERKEHNAIRGTYMTRMYCNGPLNLSQVEAPEVQPDDFCSFAVPRNSSSRKVR